MSAKLNAHEILILKDIVSSFLADMQEQVAVDFDLPPEANATFSINSEPPDDLYVGLKTWIEKHRTDGDPPPDRLHPDLADKEDIPDPKQSQANAKTVGDVVMLWAFNAKWDFVDYTVISRGATYADCVAQAVAKATENYQLEGMSAERFAHIVSIITSDGSGVRLTDGAVSL